jgi:hypothetical protein
MKQSRPSWFLTETKAYEKNTTGLIILSHIQVLLLQCSPIPIQFCVVRCIRLRKSRQSTWWNRTVESRQVTTRL